MLDGSTLGLSASSNHWLDFVCTGYPSADPRHSDENQAQTSCCKNQKAIWLCFSTLQVAAALLLLLLLWLIFVCRADSYYHELVIRCRAFFLVLLPIVAPSNGFVCAALAMCIFASTIWFSWEHKPFMYLRNNQVSKLAEWALIVLLFAGLIFSGNPDSVTDSVVAYCVVVFLVAVFLVCVHAIFFEMFYFSNELFRKYRCFNWLFDTKFMIFLFSTHRSYLTDFKKDREEQGMSMCAPIGFGDLLNSFFLM